MSTYENDYDWQRTHLPRVKQVLAHYLIDEAPVEEDRNHNTDLMVLKLDTVRIACRLRHHDQLFCRDYRNEFTIRSRRPSGIPTELPKVISGWGDYIFYGFANQDDTGLAAWVLGDLNVFRLWHSRELWRTKKPPGQEFPNWDRSSWFFAYRIADLPSGFVKARLVFDEHAAEMLPL